MSFQPVNTDTINDHSEKPWSRELHHLAQEALVALGPLVDRADPYGRVAGRSRLLCAGLGALSRACHEALGGAPDPRVAWAGAALSLLTKVDDQVIDAPDFHGGADVPRALVEARVRAFLAPTLDSLVAARPCDDSPRAALAAALGMRLRALRPSPRRLERLLDVIARGWEIQARAVGLFSRHPSEADPSEVEEVTAAISGLWLLMITMIGALPPDARRPMSAAEEDAFMGWGRWIQRADALADLDKDRADALWSSTPGSRAWHLGADWTALDDAGAYAAVFALDIDRTLMPDAGTLTALATPLTALGAVPGLLGWIHGFLSWRYLRHPLCQRPDDDPAFAHALTRRADQARYLALLGATRDIAHEGREGACSGR